MPYRCSLCVFCGPFVIRIVKGSGGIGIATLKERIADLNRFKTFVGWLESAMYDDNTPVAGIAAVHEYGSVLRGIPPRPFLRTATEESKEEWKAIIRHGAKSILNGSMTSHQVVEILGLKISGDIKKAIKNVTSPELAQSTIEARLRKKADGKTIGNLDKPLVETSIMLNTVTYEARG